MAITYAASVVQIRPKLAGLLRSMATSISSRRTAQTHWTAAWSAAPDTVGPALVPQSIRQIVRTSIGGSGIRVRLSNLFGTAPLKVGSVRVAASAGGTTITPGTDRVVTFNGESALSIPEGSAALSDGIPFQVPALTQLVISLFLPTGAESSTVHTVGLQTAFIATGEDITGSTSFPSVLTASCRYFLTDVEVEASASARTIVTFGDSNTDGYSSTHNCNARWPDWLAQRIQSNSSLAWIGVVNSGISANRILFDGEPPIGGGPSALLRFDRDALTKSGLGWILLFEGINDVLAGSSTPSIIDGMKMLVARAHERRIQIWGATLIPFGDWPFYSAGGEESRQTINAWIRTSGVFDAVVDFDQAIRDPARPTSLLPAFDSGDHLHPSDAGYRAMAEAIDLGLFQR